MPPSSRDHEPVTPPAHSGSKKPKEVLHAKFSDAARALTELFRESTDAYEAGYRDALLYVHRYVLLASTTYPPSCRCACHESRSRASVAQASARPLPIPPPPPPPPLPECASAAPVTSADVWASVPTLSPQCTVASTKMLRFLQSTAQRRKERVAAERGTLERLRRRRASSESATESDGEAEHVGHPLQDTQSRPGTLPSEPAEGAGPPTEALGSNSGGGDEEEEQRGSVDGGLAGSTQYRGRGHRECLLRRKAFEDPLEAEEEPPRRSRRCRSTAAPGDGHVVAGRAPVDDV